MMNCFLAQAGIIVERIRLGNKYGRNDGGCGKIMKLIIARSPRLVLRKQLLLDDCFVGGPSGQPQF
jgi:hypothetical protein